MTFNRLNGERLLKTSEERFDLRTTSINTYVPPPVSFRLKSILLTLNYFDGGTFDPAVDSS